MNTVAIDLRENYLLDRRDFLHAALEYPWRKNIVILYSTDATDFAHRRIPLIF